MEKYKKTIAIEKFDKLEKKYSKLCSKHQKLLNKTKKFELLPQAVFNLKTGAVLMLQKFNPSITYLITKGVSGVGYCDVCCKKRKTTAHHIIPLRMKAINKELAKVRIRVCRDCKEKIHPENGYDQNEIIKKQERLQMKLQDRVNKKAEDIIYPFITIVDIRIEDLKNSIPQIVKELKETDPTKIYPAHKKVEGRLNELEWIKRNFRGIVNKSLGTIR